MLPWTRPLLKLHVGRRECPDEAEEDIAGQADIDVKPCPNCSRPIQVEALKCRWCRTWLSPPEHSQDPTPTGPWIGPVVGQQGVPEARYVEADPESGARREDLPSRHRSLTRRFLTGALVMGVGVMALIAWRLVESAMQGSSDKPRTSADLPGMVSQPSGLPSPTTSCTATTQDGEPIDICPMVAREFSTYVGLWRFATLNGEDRLLINEDGFLILVAGGDTRPGTASMAGDHITLQITGYSRLQARAIEIGDTVALLLTQNECSDAAMPLDCGVIWEPVIVTSGAAETPAATSEPLEVLDVHPQEAFKAGNYFGTWVNEGSTGTATMVIRRDGTFTYEHVGSGNESTVAGTWTLNGDTGFLLLLSDRDPASVALVLLADRQFALLFTSDTCDVFDSSCGDILTTSR